MSGTDKAVPERSAVATKLLPKFIGHRARDVGTIRDALAQRDFEAIARIGHNMRGNGRSYGFPDIGLLGERLEEAGDAKDEHAIREQLVALEAWLAAQGTPTVVRNEGGQTPGR
jgi:HPt (histidine-containing phosphotransfer) domain-containing protein